MKTHFPEFPEPDDKILVHALEDADFGKIIGDEIPRGQLKDSFDKSQYVKTLNETVEKYKIALSNHNIFYPDGK